MTDPTPLTAADAALDRLRDEAEFAGAQHGAAHRTSLMHYHDLLQGTMMQAFEEHARASVVGTSRRDRIAFRAHASAIAEAVTADVDAVLERHARLVARASGGGTGARATIDATIARGMTVASTWWDGRFRLGSLTSESVARRPHTAYRPMPLWVPVGIGTTAVAAIGVPIMAMLLR